MKPSILGTGKVEELACKKELIPEFPGLLFGEHLDGGNYFDATSYLQLNSKDKLSVNEFFTYFNFQIQALAESYSIPQDKLVIINQEGHQLIAGCMCFLFLSYVHPSLNAHLFERIDELFANGITMSDSYLAQATRERFSPQTIANLANEKTPA